MRLNSLYKKLVNYSFLTIYGEAAATKAGVRPSQQAYFIFRSSKGVSVDRSSRAFAARSQAGRTVFDNASYHQTTSAAGGIGVGHRDPCW
jgi:hypothetical protein